MNSPSTFSITRITLSARSVSAVCTNPGHSAVARIPKGAYSTASPRVSATTAPLVAE